MTALKIAEEAAAPTAEIYTITPAVAKRWLTRNVRNRKVKPASVAAYARDMAAGRWKLTGEAIKFDTNGALSDGQNRLHAIVKANVSVTMLVVRGIEPDAQAVMDSGVKRSISDTFTMQGETHPTIMAAAARLALGEPAAGFGNVTTSKANVTNSEIAEFVDEFRSELIAGAKVAAHYYPSFDAPPSVLCIAWMRLSVRDIAAATEFFTSIADCRTDGPGDPRLALIRRLSTIRKNRERLSQVGYLSLIFRAWNAWRSDQLMANLPTHIGRELVRVPRLK